MPGTRQGWWNGYYDAVAAAEAEEGRALKPSEVSRHYVGRAVAWMSGDPVAAARLLAWKARLLATNVELANNQDVEFTARRTLPALRYSPSRWDLLFGFGLVGLVLAWRRGQRGAGVLLGFTAVYALSIVLFFVNARFRVPLLPALSVGAGYALVQLAAGIRARDVRACVIVSAPALLLVGLSNLVPAAVQESDAAGLADLGRAELARGESEAALELLSAATAEAPRSVQVRMALAAAIVAATGDHERALRALQDVEGQATARDRAELEAQIFGLRIQAGEAAEVLAEVSAARRARPDEGALTYVFAMAQAACGQASGAILTLEGLAEREPTNIAALIFLGRLQEDLGRSADARSTFAAAMDRVDLATPSEAASIAAGLARGSRD